LASGSQDNTIKLWSVASQKEVATLQGHSKGVTSTVFSPDGKYLASASCDNSVKVWSVKSQKEASTQKVHTYAIYSVAFSPDG
jgi:WD40 repeat protein